MPNNAQNLESTFEKHAQSVKTPQSEASLKMDCHPTANAVSHNDDKTIASEKVDSSNADILNKPAKGPIESKVQNVCCSQAAKRQDFGDKNEALQGDSRAHTRAYITADLSQQSPFLAQKPTPETKEAQSFQTFRVVFLSVLYSGKSPKAPGTAGSALSVLLGLPILLYSAQTLFLLACLLGIIAVREIDKWEAYSKKHDEKWIVIDELVGVWLAMSIVCYGNYSLGLTSDKSADMWRFMSILWHEGYFVHIVLAFVLFRVFDIWKPSIIGRIDRELKGGLGVVLDDAVAGVMAGLAGILVLFVCDETLSIITAQIH